MSIRTQKFLARLAHERFIADLAHRAREWDREVQARADARRVARSNRRPREMVERSCRTCGRTFRVPAGAVRAATQQGWYRLQGFCGGRCAGDYLGD